MNFTESEWMRKLKSFDEQRGVFDIKKITWYEHLIISRRYQGQASSFGENIFIGKKGNKKLMFYAISLY